MIEIRALAFAHVVNPVAFEVITVSLSKDSVTVAFAFVPLSLIDVFI
jgi:hypothetical protein